MGKEPVRANKLIWKIAEWLYNELDENSKYTNFSSDTSNSGLEILRKFYYDKAIQLLKKIANNEFTGPDNHE